MTDVGLTLLGSDIHSVAEAIYLLSCAVVIAAIIKS